MKKEKDLQRKVSGLERNGERQGERKGKGEVGMDREDALCVCCASDHSI